MNSAARIVDSPGFHRVVTVAIVACSVLVGLERAPIGLPQSVCYGLDWFFGVFFFVEIVLRIAADGLGFFRIFKRREHGVTIDERGFWNVFDLAIVSLSFMTLAAHVFQHPEFLFVARLARIFRVLRLLEISTQLKVIEKRIVAVIPTVFAFIMLLTVLIYIYAVIASHIFEGVPAFASVEDAALSMFQVLTLDNWSDVMREAATKYPLVAPLFFVSFIVLTAIVSLNVFIAALSHQMEIEMSTAQEIAEVKPELKAIADLERRILAELKALQSQLERERRDR